MGKNKIGARTCPHCGRVLSRGGYITGPYETREDLRKEVIRLFYKRKLLGTEIAEQLQISRTTVSRILHGDKRQEN